MLEKYIGEKCLVCGEVFTDTDDIVVCPDCGSPYHRECWDKEGCCIKTDLHEAGLSWQPEAERPGADGEPIRCSRCGQENPPEGLFCNRCGLPLNTASLNQSRAFNEPPPNGAPGYGPYGQQ